jgi:CRP/FNR family transcriptional regulator, anaerobic regulatory protein
MDTRPSSAAGDFVPSQIPLSCSPCAACERNLCQAVARAAGSSAEGISIVIPQSVHLINARRVIHWGHDLHDVVPVICEGWAASLYMLSDGSRQILSILLPGDLVSTALLFGAQAGCSVEAITDVRYRTFAQTDLKARLLNDADCFARFLRACIDEKDRADQLITDLGRRTAHERIARLILDLQSRLMHRGMVQSETLEMEFPLRHHHIADATGLSLVHVSKVLSEFRRSGVVKISDRSLTILNPEALRRIAVI